MCRDFFNDWCIRIRDGCATKIIIHERNFELFNLARSRFLLDIIYHSLDLFLPFFYDDLSSPLQPRHNSLICYYHCVILRWINLRGDFCDQYEIRKLDKTNPRSSVNVIGNLLTENIRVLDQGSTNKNKFSTAFIDCNYETRASLLCWHA